MALPYEVKEQSGKLLVQAVDVLFLVNIRSAIHKGTMVLQIYVLT